MEESVVQASGPAFSGLHSFITAVRFPWLFAMLFSMFPWSFNDCFHFMQFTDVFVMQFNKNTSVSVKNPTELITRMLCVIVELQHLSIMIILYCSYPKCYTLSIVPNNFLNVGFIFHFLSGYCQGTHFCVFSCHCFNCVWAPSQFCPILTQKNFYWVLLVVFNVK